MAGVLQHAHTLIRCYNFHGKQSVTQSAIRRCQRRWLGKCLPSDTHLGPADVPRIKHSKCNSEQKAPQSICLVTLSGSTSHQSLATFLHRGPVNALSFPLCPRSSAAAPWDGAGRLPLGCQYHRLYVNLQRQPRQGWSLTVPPRAPTTTFWERGEQWGKHRAPCLHHQHSGALCALWSRITELLSNREQHKLWRECSGKHCDRTCVCVWAVFFFF